MIPFTQIILRSYYKAIGWNQDNSYSGLTRGSSSLLDFQIPQSLILHLANAPTSTFFTSYALDALPQLNGSVSYITTSEGLDGLGIGQGKGQGQGQGRGMGFREVVDRFRVYGLPGRPKGKDEVWLGGRRVEGRDYLLYSHLSFPSLALSGLATTRLTPTLQLHLGFLSHPQPPSARPTSPTLGHSRQPSETQTPIRPPNPDNIVLSLQHDVGRYSSESTYSLQDGMFGWKGLWNFGWKAMALARSRLEEEGIMGRERVEDEEKEEEEGSKGRFSAGGEVYFSAKQRSFGLSTGLRYTTLPSPFPFSGLSTPPTTLTLIYNPLIGYISTAYSAQVSPTIALSSRYGVNVYSYESDLSIGGEWWIGRRRGKRAQVLDDLTSGEDTAERVGPGMEEKIQGREAILEGGDLRNSTPTSTSLREEDTGPFANERVYPIRHVVDTSIEVEMEREGIRSGSGEDRDGIIKAKISGNWSIALLYEARIKNCLVSIGVISDLIGRGKPIKSVGVEVQYFS